MQSIKAAIHGLEETANSRPLTPDENKVLNTLYKDSHQLFTECVEMAQQSYSAITNSPLMIIQPSQTESCHDRFDPAKRRRLNSPTRKHPIPAHSVNIFDALPILDPQPDPNSDDDMEPETSPKNSTPIILRDKSKWLVVLDHLRLNNIQIPPARNVTEGIQFIVPTPDNFRSVTLFLQQSNIPFHTFQLPEDRSLKVMLRGIPEEIPSELIFKELEQRKLPVINVHRLSNRITKRPMPLVRVDLKKTTDSNKIYNLEFVTGVRIKIEAARTFAGPSQCHRCQKFGHASERCFVSPKCLKCAGDHYTSTCSKSRDTPATCANCGGPHTANYRGCSTFPKPWPLLQPPTYIPAPSPAPLNLRQSSYAQATRQTATSHNQSQPPPTTSQAPTPTLDLSTILLLITNNLPQITLFINNIVTALSSPNPVKETLNILMTALPSIINIFTK